MSINNMLNTVTVPISGAEGGTGVSNSGKTITIGGNTAFSGSFTFTGTLTGNTAVTFPTSGTLITAVGSGGLKSFTYLTTPGSGTYTPPAGIHSIMYEIIGAGGGGGGAQGGVNTTAAASGGAGGAYGRTFVAFGALAVSYAYTVGAGGTGGAAGNNNGSNGGDTTFGPDSSAEGGIGGLGSLAVSNVLIQTIGNPNSGGAAFSNDINVTGGIAAPGLILGTYFFSGNGGSGIYGTGGPGLTIAENGNPGLEFGAGGGGGAATTTNLAGGNGADGLIIIWEFA